MTRNRPSDVVVRKIYIVCGDTPTLPRKVILVIADDMRQMIEDTMAGEHATA